MAIEQSNSASSNTSQLNFAEDPRREPHEKETALHLEGDGTHFTVRSFKKVFFAKVLQRPEFSVTRIYVLTHDGQDGTVDSLDNVAAESGVTITGVEGRLPVGAMNIGKPRNSNSHADIVK